MRAELQDLLSYRGLAGRALPVSRGRCMSSAPAGAHIASSLGRGMSFAESRPYLPGDDLRSVDWRVTARTGRPFTKRYEVEHERPLWLLIDQGPSMQFGSQGCFKSVQAARASAWLSWNAVRLHDRVGAVLVEESGVQLLPSVGARRGVLRLLQMLSEDVPERLVSSPETSSEISVFAGLTCLRPHVRGGDRVVVLSDFHALSFHDSSPDGSLLDQLAALACVAELSLVHVFDGLEQTPPPPGRYAVTVGDQSHSLDLSNEAIRQAWHLQFFQRNATLRDFSMRHRVRLLDLSTEQPVAETLWQSWGRT